MKTVKGLKLHSPWYLMSPIGETVPPASSIF